VYGCSTELEDTPPMINLSLKPSTKLRDYQQLAIESTLWDGQMHSGVIVLPCGAGKTATGVNACCAAGRKAIIFVTSSVAAEQWRLELVNLAETSAVNVRVLTAESSNRGGWQADADIAITTYSLFTGAGKRAGKTQQAIEWLRSQCWGLLLLDEVQFAPAETFRKVTQELQAACRIGLTATMVREDNLIQELKWLVGPVLFQLDLPTLRQLGYINKAIGYEVHCAMAPLFQEAFEENAVEVRRVVATANAEKVHMCARIVHHHVLLGDKVLVFCDDLISLEWYAKVLQCGHVDGDMKLEERQRNYDGFRSAVKGACLVVSRVADHSIDLPEANVSVQVSIIDGSRMQEAQRVGRIQRLSGAKDQRSSTFYSLISSGTHEEGYSHRRRKFLVDHGYVVNTVEDLSTLVGDVEGNHDFLQSEDKQRMLLKAIARDMIEKRVGHKHVDLLCGP